MKSQIPTLFAILALVATAVTQSVATSNATTINPQFALNNGTNAQDKLADINALTTAAFNLNGHRPVGLLYLATTNNEQNITSSNIAYVSCDANYYPGNLQASDVITAAIGRSASAIILYSIYSETCVITGSDNSINSTIVFAIAGKNESQMILNNLNALSSGATYRVQISLQPNGSASANNGTDNNGNSNPLGPSPSTAVAMIILYSITGVITALFLIIIITGAVRAHRHPDRYGPRDVLGRPRQSRAKGLARAMLDSIPIVKFGENEAPKPADVELGSQHDVSRSENQFDQQTPPAEQSSSEDATESASTTQDRNLPEGIAPAEDSTARHSEVVVASEHLGCSICTDDFEKGQDIRVLPCDHKFHPACIDPWLLNVSATCPLCRIDLRPTASRKSGDAEQANENEEEGEGGSSNALAPPLEDSENTADQAAPNQASNRDSTARRSRLVSFFAPDRLHASTAEERLSAARRLREQSVQGASELSTADASTGQESTARDENGDEVRRRRRLTTRLQDVFGVRTRRQEEVERTLPNSETRE